LALQILLCPGKPCCFLFFSTSSGIGPLGEYLLESRQFSVLESKTDLRDRLPFEDAQFDPVICTETIEHNKDVDSQEIKDLESFNYSGINNLLAEIGRILKPKGKLLVTTPNANSYNALAKWLTGQLPLMHAEHVNEFSIGELKRVVAQAGLTVEHIATYDSWQENFWRGISQG
jgi:SAM-dependent methyltransferase